MTFQKSKGTVRISFARYRDREIVLYKESGECWWENDESAIIPVLIE